MPERPRPHARNRLSNASLILWRAYVPRWAHAPLSGDGAAQFGGRWNPVGAPTLYAARELSTAWAEYNQGFVQHPATIAQMSLHGAKLTDLCNETVLAAHVVDATIHSCEWRAHLDEGRIPATHKLREHLLAAGFDGVIYPSFMSPGGSCVALWRWNEPEGPELTVVDPEGRLPKSAASWR